KDIFSPAGSLIISSAPGGGLLMEIFKAQGGGTLFMHPEEGRRKNTIINQRKGFFMGTIMINS
ncbi:MAG: hypothetical protein Q7U55_01805, partial [Deltaproteobacteria bacterium]|nr:hypothetical protein [Deltaproteobacteria bacterium]